MYESFTMVSSFFCDRVVSSQDVVTLPTARRPNEYPRETPQARQEARPPNEMSRIIRDNEAKVEENKKIEETNQSLPDDEKQPLQELETIPVPDTKLFGLIDLSVSAGFTSVSAVAAMVFALAAALGQYLMVRQQNPSNKKRRTFKQIMREAADGKEANQSELNAMVSGQMTKIMPIMMLLIMINLPGALVFYYMMSNFITIAQQKIILNRAEDKMEQSADKAIIKELNKIQEGKVKVTRIKASNKRRKK